MSYVGNVPTTAAFPFDQFSGNGSTTAFTLSYAPAGTTSIIVSISGVVQNPNTYSVSGTTLTFTPAPPTGSNNIAVLYLGLPVVATLSPGNTAYFSSSVFTATAGQTVFTPSGTYQTGFINVIRNGAQLAPADYTATNGTTVTLANACTAGDIVVIEVYNLVSIANALPATGGTVTGATTFNSTVQVNGANVSGFTGFKNRIINPGMVIDQRNNGASVTPTDGQYVLDRWQQLQNPAAKYSVQQNAGSVTPPAGFTNYLGCTSLSAYALGTSNYFFIRQKIEGFNVADFGWGTANAATVTLSFWVRSSLTGTFGGSITNSAETRSYPFTYIISAANTWEQKSVTISGDTTGTWLTNNGAGINVGFGIGVASNFSGTAGVWAGSALYSATGATSVVGTNGATFYITGVQLERGSNATSYEFRSYGQELALCQRYYYKVFPAATTKPLTQTGWFGSGCIGFNKFPVNMRTPPTALEQSGTANQYAIAYITSIATCNAVPSFSNATVDTAVTILTTATAITNGQGVAGYTDSTNGASAFLAWSAEL